MIKNPDGYYGNFDPTTKGWKRVEFKPGFPVQSAELNDMQTIQNYQLEQIVNRFFKDGTFLNGGDVATTPDEDGLLVTIAASQIWGLGFVHNVAELTCVITGVGKEVIYLKLTDDTQDYTDDPDLLCPVIGAENYTKPGADRLQFSYSYVVNDPTGIPVATFVDGQLVTPPTNTSSLLDEVYKVLAQRTDETSGSYFAVRPRMDVADVGEKKSNPAQLALNIGAGGVAYIRGWRRSIPTNITLPILRPMVGEQRLDEPETYFTATKVYSLDNPPHLQMDKVLATVQSGTIPMSRGQAVNTADPIPEQYQPTDAIVSVTAGATTYIQGTDYNKSGNSIVWLSGGSQPTPGSSYNMVVNFTKTMTKGIRVLTKVTAEAKTVTSGSITLAHNDISEITLLEKSDHSVQYEQGANPGYTVDTSTGVCTFTGVSNSTAVLVTYTYWAHQTEGDYVSRDSFRDAAGNILYYSSPTKTVSGLTVDFLKQISFDTTGTKPVNTSTFYMTYTYPQGRVDALVWRGGTGGASGVGDGLDIIQGVPGIHPAVPTINKDYLPVAKLYVPAEAFASDVSIEWYDNVTMTVVQQRALEKKVEDLRYNQAQFQLAQDTLSIPTSTDKRGVFAEPFVAPNLADLTNPDFAGTFDFFSQTFSLPRLQQDKTPTISSAAATLRGDMWFPNYAEELSLSQPFASGARVINKYDNVNARALITLDPPVDTRVKPDLFDIYTSVSVTGSSTADIKHHQLLAAVSPNTLLAQTIGLSASNETPAVLNKIPLDTAWSSVSDLLGEQLTLSYNEVSTDDAKTRKQKGDQWKKILSNAQSVAQGYIEGGLIEITGKFFTPNERAISAEFDGAPVDLSPVGATVAETDPMYPGCVKADSNGEFVAQLNVPEGLATGSHLIELLGRDLSDNGRILSYATANYVSNPSFQEQSLYVTVTLPQKIANQPQAALHVLCNALGVGAPNKKVLQSQNGAVAYSIAYAIIQAQDQGVTVTVPSLTAAIQAMFSVTTLGNVIGIDTHIAAMAGAANLQSTDAIANGNLMIAASAYATTKITRQTLLDLDPLAQTFRLDETSMVSSIDLFFQTVPAADPVAVAICTTQVGIPTQDYLAVSWKQPNQCNNTSNTRFAFDKPVYLEAGVEYAFVVLTNDSAASLKVAQIGQVDTTSNQLIVKNPATGALLESPNASSWSLLSSEDLKFNINVAAFNDSETILSLGQQTFSPSISMLSLNVPFVEPSPETSVTFQYSLNNQQWFDFPPLKELDLGNAYSSVYFRLKLKNTVRLCPPVVNAASLSAFIYQSPGAYVHREFSLPTAQADVIDIFVETDLPGSTAVTLWVQLDGETYEQLAEISADARVIDDVFTERHFQYEAEELKQDVRGKAILTSAASYISPRIRKLRVLAG